MPRRTLGRTGVSVSILAMGCGSRFLAYPADQATAVLEKAVGLGINYLDTAVDYGQGESETRVGRFVATRRRDVFLATKVPQGARTRDAALREVEASLKRLRTDHVDLLHLHGLGDEADLAKIEAADGALKALYELRAQKVARFVGMTSHSDGAVMAKAIERHDLDCVQMAMNPSRALRFEELALPAANRKNLGVILMKVTGQDKLLGAGKADAASLLRYAWSLPISTAVCGMPKLEFLEANVATARAYTSRLLAGRDGSSPPAVRVAHGHDGALLRAPRRRRGLDGVGRSDRLALGSLPRLALLTGEQRHERGVAVHVGERRVVVERLGDVGRVGVGIEERLPDVNQLARAVADDVDPAQHERVALEEQLHEPARAPRRSGPSGSSRSARARPRTESPSPSALPPCRRRSSLRESRRSQTAGATSAASAPESRRRSGWPAAPAPSTCWQGPDTR